MTGIGSYSFAVRQLAPLAIFKRASASVRLDLLRRLSGFSLELSVGPTLKGSKRLKGQSDETSQPVTISFHLFHVLCGLGHGSTHLQQGSAEGLRQRLSQALRSIRYRNRRLTP